MRPIWRPKSPAPFRAATAPTVRSIPISGWTPRSSAGSTISSCSRIAAAKQAVADSGWEPASEEDRNRTGVLIGSGIGGLNGIAETALLLQEKGPRRVSPFFIPGRLINLVSGYASIQFGYKGPNHAVVTACATGAHAIGDAARLIALDDADMMLAGGAEAAIGRLGIAGFNACRALSTAWNDTPEKASRPYDKDRDGFVMGEGAGMCMLEEYEHAKARGAKMLRRSRGLRIVRRCLPHYRAIGRRRRRLPRHADGGEARRHLGFGHRLRERAWHIHHGGRHRTRRRRTVHGQCGGQGIDVIRRPKWSIGHLLERSGCGGSGSSACLRCAIRSFRRR